MMITKILDLVVIIIFETLVLSVSIVWWCCKIKEKKQFFSEVHGYLLAFPANLVEQSKSLQENISGLL